MGAGLLCQWERDWPLDRLSAAPSGGKVEWSRRRAGATLDGKGKEEGNSGLGRELSSTIESATESYPLSQA